VHTQTDTVRDRQTDRHTDRQTDSDLKLMDCCQQAAPQCCLTM